MRIEVTTAGDITLQQPDDFKAFSVLVADGGPAPDALARLGRVVDDEHVFVDPAALERLAGDRARDPEWRAALDGMIAYAAEHGWVDDAGHVRAHVERAS